MYETTVSDEYVVHEKLGMATYVPVSSGHFSASEPDALDRALEYRDTCERTARRVFENDGPEYVIRRIRVTEIPV